MKILVLNTGSSSIKYQLIEMDNEQVLARGLVERIGLPGSRLCHRCSDGSKVVIEADIIDHSKGIKMFIDALVNPEYGVISSIKEIEAIGHRILHGGEKFFASALINDDVMEAVEQCVELGPLHNPANIVGIRSCRRLMGRKIPQVGVFDTAFHQTMPEKAYIYGLPYELYEKYKIRKYGFHGTSHKYVSERVFDLLNIEPEGTRMITCHLGNGASLAAIKDGKCMDTSMGLTPLEGLVMGTRSGNIDPAIVSLIMEKEKMTADEVSNLLNKRSGVLGISGLSSDFRDLDKASQEGDERAALAIDVFVYSVVKMVGSFASVLKGLDILVFTAGLGENSVRIRKQICDDLTWLGFELDEEQNAKPAQEMIISKPGSKVTVMVVPTNEEMVIARDTCRIIEELREQEKLNSENS